jgi:FAD-dependent urate hydroxylase
VLRKLAAKVGKERSIDSSVAIIGAGPYGLSAAAYLRNAGVEARVFGHAMAFWDTQMPVGMHLRSNWAASHIADPARTLTLDAYCQQNEKHISKPIPLERFVDYGRWYQRHAVPELDECQIRCVEPDGGCFKLITATGDEIRSRRVVVAAGIGAFTSRPPEFANIPPALASHTTEQQNLQKFKGQRVVVIGGGQSALESAALLNEAGIEAEVIARSQTLNWVGLHPRLHHLGWVSKALYSRRDVGPAGVSRLVSMPHLFRCLPRRIQDRTAYRAIRPAGAGWLLPRVEGVPITLGRRVVSARVAASRLRLRFDNGMERLVDHALLATGFRVDVSRYSFLSQSILRKLETVNGFPVLTRGLESSIPGLHFVGKPASWSFGPILGFVSGAEFASTELTGAIAANNPRH